MLANIILLLLGLAFIFVALEVWALRTPNINVDKGVSTSGEQKIEAVNRWFDALDDAGRFNGAILFAKDGDILLERSFGRVAAFGTEPFSTRASFNLASVSKHMTGFAILKLAYEKKLSRTDHITKYLPELGAYEGITIDHLLYHSSGIPDYLRMSKSRMKPVEIFTADMFIRWLSVGDEPAQFKPGEKEVYSNSGYVLLAEIISRVSGQTYADYMREMIFGPLGMHDTYVVNQFTNQKKLHQRVYGFKKRWIYFGEPVVHDLNHLDGAAGDGNIYSSARDLLKWDKALRDGMRLPVDYYATAYKPMALQDGTFPKRRGEIAAWGIGWGVNADASTVYADGCWQGFNSHIIRGLEQGTTLIVLSNAGFLLRTVRISDKLFKAMDGI